MAKPNKYDPQDLSADYEVGFGKPPKATQFKKGQSGNPNGRPKGSTNLSSTLRRTLNEKVMIMESGRQKLVSKGEAAIKQLVNRAAQGELQFIRILLPAMSTAETVLAAEAGKSTVDLTDPALLAPLFEQLQRGNKLILVPPEEAAGNDSGPRASAGAPPAD